MGNKVKRRDARIYHAYLNDIRQYGKPKWSRIAKAISDIPLSKRRMREITRKELFPIYQGEPIPREHIDYSSDTTEGWEKDADEEKFHDYHQHKEEPERVEFREDGFTAEATVKTRRIKSLEDLLDELENQGADLEPWEVDRYEVTVWEMGRKKRVVDIQWVDGKATGKVEDEGLLHIEGLWRVRAVFKPKFSHPFTSVIDERMEMLKEVAPRFELPNPKPPQGEYLYVPNVYDAHFGKIHFDGEDYIGSVKRDYVKAHTELMAKAMASNREIGHIMVPIGHDLINADSLRATTTKGTWVGMADDVRDVFDIVCDTVPDIIDGWSLIAPTTVYIVPGNHDLLLMHALGKYLEAFFSKHNTVDIISMKDPRMYFQWGSMALGMTHKRHKPEKLALMMPLEAPMKWANTTWREWLTGHWHTRQQAYYMVDEVGGVVMRTIPALTPPDYWHVMMKFVGNKRAAQGLYYHKEYGPAGEEIVFADDFS